MKDCPNCGALLERADYLEGENGFEEALICMECDDEKYYPIDVEPLCCICETDDDIDQDSGFICTECASKYYLLDETNGE
ncbi:MAG: hypothetical protein ACQEXQ_08805 [Bacillota bacterium]